VAVSRLLKKAEEHGIVRTTVISPPGAFIELEGLLKERFGLSQGVIAEAGRDAEEPVLSAIGSAATQLLETMLKSGDVIGISSWSASLLSMVDQMNPVRNVQKCAVVQVLGGIGNPSAEQHANHLATGLARLVHGEARFLPAPGVVGSTLMPKFALCISTLHLAKRSDFLTNMLTAEDLVGPEWAEWYRLSPEERWRYTSLLWHEYVAFGGDLDPEPDTRSPFFDPEEWRAIVAHGRSSLRDLRRSGI
jgi:hypothetical protein